MTPTKRHRTTSRTQPRTRPTPRIPWRVITALSPVLAQSVMLVVAFMQRNWMFAAMVIPGVLMSVTYGLGSLAQAREERRQQSESGRAGAGDSGSGRVNEIGGNPLDSAAALDSAMLDPSALPRLPTSTLLELMCRQPDFGLFPCVITGGVITKGASATTESATVKGATAVCTTATSIATENTASRGPAAAPRFTWRNVVYAWMCGNSTFRVPVGCGDNEGAVHPHFLDLTSQGPHALVAGTTGSGKSMFLQSWCAAMALQVSPEKLHFVFLDFKGGATFRTLHHLPHVVGFVSDLNLAHAVRALRAIEAELKRREHLIAIAGCGTLEALPNPPARIVIVVDEFHALRFALPDYSDHLVRIAAQGRSLGMHLVLATQNPMGQVSADMKANINMNISLRVRDRYQSAEMIGSPIASLFRAGEPGMAAANDGESMAIFRSSLIGDEEELVSLCAHAARFCDLAAPSPLFSAPLPSAITVASSRSIIAARTPVPIPTTSASAGADVGGSASGMATHRPTPLPPSTTQRDSLGPPAKAAVSSLCIGLEDDGVLTFPCRLNILKGNIAVVGATGRGKTTLLQNALTQLTRTPHSALSVRWSVATPQGFVHHDIGTDTDTAITAETLTATSESRVPSPHLPRIWIVDGADEALDPLSQSEISAEFSAALAAKKCTILFSLSSAKHLRYPEHCSTRIIFPSGDPTSDVLSGIPPHHLKGWSPQDFETIGRGVLLTASLTHNIQCFPRLI